MEYVWIKGEKAFLLRLILVKKVLVAQSCLTFCDHMFSSSAVPGTLQARILEWVAIPFLTQRSNPGHLHGRQILYHCTNKGVNNWRRVVVQGVFLFWSTEKTWICLQPKVGSSGEERTEAGKRNKGSSLHGGERRAQGSLPRRYWGQCKHGFSSVSRPASVYWISSSSWAYTQLTLNVPNTTLAWWLYFTPYSHQLENPLPVIFKESPKGVPHMGETS